MIQQVLTLSDRFSNHSNGTIDNNGRVLPCVDPELLAKFPTTEGGWYNRLWSDHDLRLLSEMAEQSSRPWIIPTHKIDQFHRIKQSTNAIGIGICYDQDLYPAVIKNWSRKAALNSKEFNDIYNITHPVMWQRFCEKGLHAEFALQQILRHIHNIPRNIPTEFDINVNLGHLLVGNLNALDHLVSDSSYEFFKQWVGIQDALHQFKYDHPPAYRTILGYNKFAVRELSSPIVLSSLDMLLINHYCKTMQFKLPKTIRTNVDLAIFLDDVNHIHN